MQKSGVRGFLASFCQHWFAVMSGGLSVPFSFFAVFFDNTNARISFAILAFAAVWLAAYKIWDSERRRVIELEEKLRPKIEFIALHEVFDTSNGFERRFELEIKNNSGTDLTNCLASVVEIHAEKSRCRMAPKPAIGILFMMAICRERLRLSAILREAAAARLI